MKKLASLALLSILGMIPVISFADPIGLIIDVTCPSATGNTNNVIAHFGDYIAGYGNEDIQNQGSNPIYFKSTTLPADVPAKLTSYSNETADYNSTTGQVICSYVSNLPEEPRFSVTYTLTNAKGGTMLSQTNNFVGIRLPLGLKKG